jgi:hypothetical protein
MFCPKTRFLPNRRRAARILSGWEPRTPVIWSVVVTTHRPQGLATRKDTEPIRIRRHRSSAHGSHPFTTTFGRNRFIGTGWSPPALSHSPSWSSEPVLVSSSGYPSAKLTTSPSAP